MHDINQSLSIFCQGTEQTKNRPTAPGPKAYSREHSCGSLLIGALCGSLDTDKTHLSQAVLDGVPPTGWQLLR